MHLKYKLKIENLLQGQAIFEFRTLSYFNQNLFAFYFLIRIQILYKIDRLKHALQIIIKKVASTQMNLIIKFAILISLVGITRPNNCHYSCKHNSCLPQTYYTFCTQCPQSSELLQFNNPANLQLTFRQSNLITGLCTGIVNPTTQLNILGIILITVFAILCALTRSNQAIYLFLTVQSFSLFSYLEVAYLEPVQYILLSIQYLMPFNIIAAKSKTKDYQFTRFNFYKLQQYYITSDFSNNIIAIGIPTLIAFVGLIIMLIVRLVKKKNYQNKLLQTQSQNDIKIPAESQKHLQEAAASQDQSIARDQNLRKVEIFFMTIFLFLMQQTSLTIFVGSRVRKADQSFILLVAIGVSYLIMVIYAIVRSHFIILPYFSNDVSMFMNFCKKVISPIFVIVPIFHHYLIFIYIIIVIFVQAGFDIKNKQFKNKKRSILYRLIQFACVVFALTYYALQRLNQQSETAIMRLIFGISLVICVALILMEGGFGIYQTFFQERQSNFVKNENEQQINQNGQRLKDTKNNFNVFENNYNKTDEFLNERQDQSPNKSNKVVMKPFIMKIEEVDDEQGLQQNKNNKASRTANSKERNSFQKKKRYSNPADQQKQIYISRSSNNANKSYGRTSKNQQASMKISQNQQSKIYQNNVGDSQNNENGQDFEFNQKEAKKKKKKYQIDRQLRLRYGIK